MKVSLYKPGHWHPDKERFVIPSTPEGEIDLIDQLHRIKDGFYQDYVIAYKTGKQPHKEKIPSYTTSGVFSYRNKQGLKTHSLVLCMDIDFKDNPNLDFDNFIKEIVKWPYCFSLHKSVSGQGLCLYIKINGEKHLDSFLAIEKFLANEYQVVADSACKDVTRLRFVSFDPDLFLNIKSKTWKKYLPKEKIIPRTGFPCSDEDIKLVMDQIHARRLDITGDYDTWIKIGFAIADRFGPGGEDLFLQISQYHERTNTQKEIKQFKACCRKNDGRKPATMATFFWKAKEHGLQIYTPKTNEIISVTKSRLRRVGKNGGPVSVVEAKDSAIKTLKGGGIESPEKVVEQVEVKPGEVSENIVRDLKYFLDDYDLKFNEITRKIEVAGEDITDRTQNDIYLEAIQVFKKGEIKKELFNDVIHSTYVSSYSPFTRFIESNKDLKPKGVIDKAIACLKTIDKSKEYIDYRNKFVRKWLLSIISSIHGTYSILVLVLCSEVHGSGKTNWFRGLLPPELARYFSECKFDSKNINDDFIKMCKKLILLDDEFSGKGRKDVQQFKDITSRDRFSIRAPYGRYEEELIRLSVLCGASNEYEILSDMTGKQRRIIPLNIVDVDLVKFEKINKTELFIELYHEWKKNPNWFMLTADEINDLDARTSTNKDVTQEEELIRAMFRPAAAGQPSSSFYSTTEVMFLIHPYMAGKKPMKNICNSILRDMAGLAVMGKTSSGERTKGRYLIHKSLSY